MLDKWFKEDIEKVLRTKNIIVIIDEQNKSDFLLSILSDKKYKILEASTQIEELKVKFEIEKSDENNKCIIFTHIPLEKLSFLREYCETQGKLVIQYLHRYIIDKVFENINLQIELEPEEIIIAGKHSIGKDSVFWKNISAKGISGIFENFEEDVIRFICTPEEYEKDLDTQSKKIFFELVNGYLGSSNIDKPVSTTAAELTKAIFDNVLLNKKEKFYSDIYKKWINSKKDFEAFKKIAGKYKLPSDFDVWSVSPNHPFTEIDHIWLENLSKNINNSEWVSGKLLIIKERANSTLTEELGIRYWRHIVELLIYNKKSISGVNSLEAVKDLFVNHFYKVDSSIRHIYCELLHDKKIIKPFQEYYQSILNQFLSKWFEYFKEYKENQSGLLKNIIKENNPKIAIIVGDGISYEISQSIAQKLRSDFKPKNSFVCSDFPSETENNMSRLYGFVDGTEPSKSKREENLKNDTGKQIEFVDIDKVNYSINSEYLIISCKDIDSMGEKLQQNALKYFDQAENEIVEKIKILLGIGYNKVFLVSDHGFVLTGILEESEKINFDISKSKGEKNERYVYTEKQIGSIASNIIEFEKTYKNYKYLYFSKGIFPFKTPGVYGYSHGGITPQELITPYLTIEKVAFEEALLNVFINNKDELKEVVGNVFQVKLASKIEKGDLFSSKRKVMFLFISDNTIFQESDIIMIELEKSISKEYTFPNYDKFEILVVDANTKATLDKVLVSQKQIRKIDI